MELLWIIGALVAFGGYIWLLQVMFETSVWWGVACLLAPIAALFFLPAGLLVLLVVAIFHFGESMGPIIAILVGRFIMSICAQPGGG